MNPVDLETAEQKRWNELGEATALQSLAIIEYNRGNYVSAYAHLYAVDRIAKWYTASVKPSPTGWQPPGPVLKQSFAENEAEMNRIGEKLTPSQRA